MASPTLFGSAVRISIAAGISTAGDQLFTAITALANGHIALAWNVDNGHQITFLRANGSETGANLNSYSVANGTQTAVSSAQIGLAALSDGRVVGAWSNNTVTAADTGEAQYAYFTEADGMSAINTVVRAGFQGELAVAATTSNRFVLGGVYTGVDTFDSGRISGFNALGVQTSTDMYAGPSNVGIQGQLAMAKLANGSVVMVTVDQATNSLVGTLTSSTGTWLSDRTFTSAGQVPTSGTYAQTENVSVAALADGGFMIAYQSLGEIKYETYDANGGATSTLKTTTGASALYAPSVVGLADGRSVIFYGTTGLDIKGQVITAGGALDGAAFTVANSAATEFSPEAVVLADGRIAVSYTGFGVTGGAGDDVLYQIVDPRENGLYGVAASDQSDDWYGTATADFVLMGGGNDTFNAGAGVDFIYGGDGNDTLNGGDGGDTLLGDNGNDTLNGDAGDDALHGGIGADTLNGGDGNDFLYGGAGADVLNGGNGFDYVSYLLATSGVVASLSTPGVNVGDAQGDTYVGVEGMIGSAFADTLVGDGAVNWLYGGDDNDTLYGLGGNDVLIAGDGLDYLFGGAGADALYGGNGNDFARYDESASGLTVDLGNISANTGEAAGDTYDSIESLVGSNFGDTLRGDSGLNWLYGLDGADTLVGRAGNDLLFGGNGNDVLIGGAGADTLNGGADFDFASYADHLGGLTADLQIVANNTGEAAGDTYSLVDGLIGTAYDDSLRGDAGDNWIYGGNGADFIYGRDGADTLLGEAGNDTIYGGVGNDAIYGGLGNDTFVMAAGDGKDVIYDFVGGAGIRDRKSVV